MSTVVTLRDEHGKRIRQRIHGKGWLNSELRRYPPAFFKASKYTPHQGKREKLRRAERELG